MYRFPFEDGFRLGDGRTATAAEVIEQLSSIISDERLDRMRQVLSSVTLHANGLPVTLSIISTGPLLSNWFTCNVHESATVVHIAA